MTQAEFSSAKQNKKCEYYNDIENEAMLITKYNIYKEYMQRTFERRFITEHYSR